MISDLFIDRPRLAFVVSIVITLAGILAIGAIPVAQFPEIVPPQVTLTTLYPGADAQVVERLSRNLSSSRLTASTMRSITNPRAAPTAATR